MAGMWLDICPPKDRIVQTFTVNLSESSSSKPPPFSTASLFRFREITWDPSCEEPSDAGVRTPDFGCVSEHCKDAS